ncbi:MAG: ABC transporter ATP-binding protein [Anaerolineales bacterium]
MTTERKTLVRVENLQKHFPFSRGVLWNRQIGAIKAVDGVTFEIKQGETLGLVGESGCGKSTTGRAILQLHKPTAGKVFYESAELTALNDEGLRQLRPKMQMIFQDPYASLNPRHSVGKIIAEPMVVHGSAGPGGANAKERVAELLELVGLGPQHAVRFPHEFSGGQRQRIGIARALALNPSFVVCDEPISALDVSIQAQIVNLLQDLQERLGLTYLFIAHDMSMVRYISNRVAVMYLGKVMELTDRASLFNDPLHPYTQSLMSAVPTPNPRLEKKRKRIILKGEVPSPANPPKGCVFCTRCPLAQDICFEAVPEYRQARPNHWVACHLVDSNLGSSKIPVQT